MAYEVKFSVPNNDSTSISKVTCEVLRGEKNEKRKKAYGSFVFSKGGIRWSPEDSQSQNQKQYGPVTWRLVAELAQGERPKKKINKASNKTKKLVELLRKKTPEMAKMLENAKKKAVETLNRDDIIWHFLLVSKQALPE